MFKELKESINFWRIWIIATIYKTVLKYRRTRFGTLWLPVGLILIVLAKGILFSGILNVPTERLMPNLAVGLLLWRLISGIFVTSCSALSLFKSDFESEYYPLFTPILAAIINQLFIFAHGVLPIIIIVLLYVLPSASAVIYVLLGLALLFFTVLPAGFLLSIFCTRYRDITQLVQSNMRVIYFLTPVLWLPEMAKGNYTWALFINPFYHMIEIIRDPFIGQPIEILNWAMVFGMGVLFWSLLYIYYTKFGRRILHWL